MNKRLVLRSKQDMVKLLAVKPSAGVRLRMGVVSATGVGTVSVKLGGSTTAIAGVPYLSSYSPTVTDVVAVLQDGPALLVLGDLA